MDILLEKNPLDSNPRPSDSRRLCISPTDHFALLAATNQYSGDPSRHISKSQHV